MAIASMHFTLSTATSDRELRLRQARTCIIKLYSVFHLASKEPESPQDEECLFGSTRPLSALHWPACPELRGETRQGAAKGAVRTLWDHQQSGCGEGRNWAIERGWICQLRVSRVCCSGCGGAQWQDLRRAKDLRVIHLNSSPYRMQLSRHSLVTIFLETHSNEFNYAKQHAQVSNNITCTCGVQLHWETTNYYLVKQSLKCMYMHVTLSIHVCACMFTHNIHVYACMFLCTAALIVHAVIV